MDVLRTSRTRRSKKSEVARLFIVVADLRYAQSLGPRCILVGGECVRSAVDLHGHPHATLPLLLVQEQEIDAIWTSPCSEDTDLAVQEHPFVRSSQEEGRLALVSARSLLEVVQHEERASLAVRSGFDQARPVTQCVEGHQQFMGGIPREAGSDPRHKRRYPVSAGRPRGLEAPTRPIATSAPA